MILYDPTLRDGAQAEDVQLATGDKLKIALKLDELGLDYIEGGWPGSNQVDNEFFREARSYHFKHSRLAAFGSTHHPSRTADSDPGLNALLKSGSSVLTLVASPANGTPATPCAWSRPATWKSSVIPWLFCAATLKKSFWMPSIFSTDTKKMPTTPWRP